MSTNNSTNNSKDPNTIQTPEDIYLGVPPIDYPETPGFKPAQYVPVGGVILKDTPIQYNLGRRTIKLTARNTGDRPVQIGSHYHFFEVNRYMEFDRPASFGYHLNIPATTALRFEPGDEKEIELVVFAGKRYVLGFNSLTDGYTGGEDFPTYYPIRIEGIRKMKEYGFKSVPESEAEAGYTSK
ncbi:MAG: urease subunit beta [Bacteroidales bacterium]